MRATIEVPVTRSIGLAIALLALVSPDLVLY
jgi:hypothetical protein